MKIDKTGKPIPAPKTGNAVAQTATRGKTPTPANTSRQTDQTSVSLGTATMQLNSMSSYISNLSVVDEAKVAEIKQAIGEGRFKVNSGVVADQLIKTVRELIDNKN